MSDDAKRESYRLAKEKLRLLSEVAAKKAQEQRAIAASVDGRRMAETTEELARGEARPARSARQAPRRPTLPSQTPAEESNND